MTYVFDTSSFQVLGHYFPNRFPSFWAKFEELVGSDRIVSVREVYKELDAQMRWPHLQGWVRANKRIFSAPSPDETAFLAEIFAVAHFQQLIGSRQLLKGGPAADAFVIARAHVRQGCVVTEEKWKPNAAKIPNVCEHFDVDCINVEGLMDREGWVF